jgi:hypothetical protein
LGILLLLLLFIPIRPIAKKATKVIVIRTIFIKKK